MHHNLISKVDLIMKEVAISAAETKGAEIFTFEYDNIKVAVKENIADQTLSICDNKSSLIHMSFKETSHLKDQKEIIFTLDAHEKISLVAFKQYSNMVYAHKVIAKEILEFDFVTEN